MSPEQCSTARLAKSLLSTRHHLSLSILGGLLALIIPACSDGETTGGTGTPGATVQVPKVDAAVSAENFCAIYDELYCLANTECCSLDSERYASLDECKAISPCPHGIQRALASDALSSGTLTYDPKAAGSFLQQMAGAVSTCSAVPAAAFTGAPLFAGTLEEGADCSPVNKDEIRALTCKPRLQCALTSDGTATKGTCVQPAMVAAKKADGAACEEGIECQSGRCNEAEAKCAAKLPAEQACVYDDDCQSGRCNDKACTSTTDGMFCGTKEAPEPPSNGDSGVPQTITVWARSASGAGTNSTIRLRYWDANDGKYGCTTTTGVNSGKSISCTATAEDTSWGSPGTNFAVIGLVSNKNDGFRVDKFCVKYTSGYTWCYSEFEDTGSIDSEGCFLSLSCNSFWIDNDDHGRCHTAKLFITDFEEFSGGTVEFYDTAIVMCDEGAQ